MPATAAFLSALALGLKLHYHKIVKNEFYGYPQEWFPSVSATIGDRYPERSFFQFFIALTSGMLSVSELVRRMPSASQRAARRVGMRGAAAPESG